MLVANYTQVPRGTSVVPQALPRGTAKLTA
jgi:hypothetical protein